MKQLKGQGGFTIGELLVALVLAVLVIGGMYQVLISQNRLYSKQRQVEDVRRTLRAAANLLAFELRGAASAQGDLYAINDSFFSVRSILGTGIICVVRPPGQAFGLIYTAGDLTMFTEGNFGADSALILAVNASGSSDDTWRARELVAVTDNPAVITGLQYCSYGDSATVATEYGVLASTVAIDAPPWGVEVGAPIRLFTRVFYGIIFYEGRWWLGRSHRTFDDYERLIGPLKSPADSGLVFTFYDSTGAVTTDPTEVHMADIVLRAESLGQARLSNGALAFSEDSLTLRVNLRN